MRRAGCGCAAIGCAIPLVCITVLLGAGAILVGNWAALAAPDVPDAPPAVSDIPPRYLALYRDAAARFGLDWPVLAAVGKVEVMATGGDTCLRHSIILILERSCGMDDGIDLQCRKLLDHGGNVGIERDALLFRQPEVKGEMARLGRIATGDEQAYALIPRERAADDGSEIPVPPQDQNSVQAWQPLRFYQLFW